MNKKKVGIIASSVGALLVLGMTVPAWADTAGQPATSVPTLRELVQQQAQEISTLQTDVSNLTQQLQTVSKEQGPAGPIGATGPQGPQGPKGDTGANGADGAIGPQGPKGDTGATGAVGPQGLQGVAGQNGTNGNTILNGTVVPDATLGNIGDFYIDTQTHTMYGPKTANGWDSGTSLVGPQGAKGDTGAQGIQGDTGATGAVGATGATGAIGPQGPKGDTGATGATGATGQQGATGATGPQGPQGPAGPVNQVTGVVTSNGVVTVSTKPVTVTYDGKELYKLVFPASDFSSYPVAVVTPLATNAQSGGVVTGQVVSHNPDGTWEIDISLNAPAIFTFIASQAE